MWQARLRTVFAVTLGLLALVGGCERKQRARERDRLSAKVEVTAAPRAPKAPTEEAPFGPLRAPGSGLPCAVDDAFAAKCRRCHTVPTRHGAPFVFLTWEDTQQLRSSQPLYQLIGRAVRSGFMPYKVATIPPVESLSESEKQTILDWVDRGAPREACPPTARVKPPRRSPGKQLKRATPAN